MEAIASNPSSNDCTKLLDLPDALLECLVRALSIKDPTSFKHGLICRKFVDISPAAHSCVEITTIRYRPRLVTSGLAVLVNLSRLSITFHCNSTHLQDLFVAAPCGWSRLQVFTSSGPHGMGTRPRFLCSEALDRFFEGCRGLRSLKLEGVMGYIPPSVTRLARLEKLVLTFLVVVPDNFGDLRELRHLELSTSQAALPSSFTRLSALQVLKLTGHHLRYLPGAMGELSSLTSLSVSANWLQVLPETFVALTGLKELRFPSCRSLVTGKLEQFASTLRKLNIAECPLPMSSCSSWSGLRELITSDVRHILQLSVLSNLRSLGVHHTTDQIPESIGVLQHLKSLELVGLQSVEHLPEQLTSLEHLTGLEISDCDQLRDVGHITGLCSLKRLHIKSCNNFHALPQDLVQRCPALQELKLDWLLHLQELPAGLRQGTRLQRVQITNCGDKW